MHYQLIAMVDTHVMPSFVRISDRAQNRRSNETLSLVSFEFVEL